MWSAGTEEEQRIRIRCQDKQRDDAEPEKGRRLPGEPLVRADSCRRGTSRCRATIQPSRATNPQRRSSPSTGQSPAAGTAGFGGPRHSRRPRPEEAEGVEREPDEQPERDACAQAPYRGQQRDPPPPAPREEIDDRDEVGDQQTEEQQLDRPPPHDPVAEPKVGRRSLGEPEPLVERPDQLRGAAHLLEPRCRQVRRLVGERIGWPRAGRRQGHGRDARGNERCLLVEVERKAEIDQLPQHADVRPGSRRSARRRAAAAVSTSPAAGERGVSPVISMRGSPFPAIAVRTTTATISECVRAANRGTDPAERAAVGGQEDDRVTWSAPRRPPGRSRAPARQGLAVPLALSFAPRPGTRVVTVGNDEDRL